MRPKANEGRRTRKCGARLLSHASSLKLFERILIPRGAQHWCPVCATHKLESHFKCKLVLLKVDSTGWRHRIRFGPMGPEPHRRWPRGPNPKLDPGVPWAPKRIRCRSSTVGKFGATCAKLVTGRRVISTKLRDSIILHPTHRPVQRCCPFPQVSVHFWLQVQDRLPRISRIWTLRVERLPFNHSWPRGWQKCWSSKITSYNYNYNWTGPKGYSYSYNYIRSQVRLV